VPLAPHEVQVNSRSVVQPTSAQAHDPVKLRGRQ